ncbi:MAG: glutamate synthase-related protein, partial [Nitrospinota bacterium]
ADVILISGHDGGTGASPLSSIKNAGSPWEVGIAETQQVLVMNDLRGRVILRTDGGMKTGRDVVMAALLGAEEYGFGTAPLVASGCVMARQCHLNTCPVGVATQREDLRAKFAGTPEGVVNFFRNIAQEVREILASMGFRSLDNIIGRAELLEQVRRDEQPRAQTLDLSAVIARVDPEGKLPRRRIQDRNDRPDVPLDLRIIEDARPAIERRERVELRYSIRNVHRSVGTRLAGEVARRYGNRGLPEGTIRLRFSGSAGQSFGAFSIGGITLALEGEANDYVGKGLHGGEIILRPSARAHFTTHENVIMGNTVLYGATGGYLFAAGRAGERFAVRNSAATAVVEGVGDHGCEYMTGGLVVVLGSTGRNFGAGMTNGLAYVLDETGDFPEKVNPELVDIERAASPEDARTLKDLIRRHLERTDSPRARAILDRWEEFLPLFWKVVPRPARAKEPPPKPEAPARVAAAAGRG